MTENLKDNMCDVCGIIYPAHCVDPERLEQGQFLSNGITRTVASPRLKVQKSTFGVLKTPIFRPNISEPITKVYSYVTNNRLISIQIYILNH